jgi:hypothetical protein
VQRRVTYHILTDGDRHLRGKIAELIFERVKPNLFKKTLNCCSTLDLRWFLNYGLQSMKVEDLKLFDEKSLQLSYVRALNELRELLGLEEHKELPSLLSDESIRKSLGRLCLICLEKGEIFIHAFNHVIISIYAIRVLISVGSMAT